MVIGMKMKAYLTVYLALSLTALLAVVMALFAGAKKNTIRMEEEFALDTAGYSALAEYDQELLKRYDLLFIDASYGSRKPDVGEVGNHIKQYANKNLEGTGLFKSRISLIGLQDVEVATDWNGAVFKRQIMEYEENFFGIDAIEALVSEFAVVEGGSPKTDELMKKRDENAGQLAAQKSPTKTVRKERYNAEKKKKESYEEKEDVPIKDPAARVNEMRNGGMLHLLVKDSSAISDKSVNLEEYVSHRSGLLQGTGLLQERDQGDSLLVVGKEKVLLDAYIFQKYGCYGKVKANSALDYQVEYLIGKKASDVENLKAVTGKLLLVREAANAAYLYSDAEKRAEIAALAASVAAVVIAPYLQPLIETSILFAWAFVESAQDVKGLLAGGKVPLVKTAADWQTGLGSIFDFGSPSYTKPGSRGLTYQQYLSALLLLEREEDLLFSMMDVVEMDIRKTAYHENFRMDGCVSGFRVAAKFEDDSGGCSFLRAYYY